MASKHTLKTIADGMIGATAALFAVIQPFQEQIEWSIRMIGGVLGIAVAAVTLYRLLTRKTP